MVSHASGVSLLYEVESQGRGLIERYSVNRRVAISNHSQQRQTAMHSMQEADQHFGIPLRRPK